MNAAPAAAVAQARATFDSGRTRPLPWRREQLGGLARLLVEREPELLDALASDLGRPAFEGWLADLRATVKEIRHLERHLDRWTRVERVRPPWQLAATKTTIRREPLGVVLVIGPWNYPIHLTITPLAAAIAAGNSAVVKPSEVSPKVSATLADLLPRYVDPAAVVIVEGGVPETTELLAERFDHIFYTGNGTVGRIVAEAAAKHLTPTTLELGGKCPVIVARDADLSITAARVGWGKFINAGQTCVSPDYVLVEEDVHDRLVDELVRVVRKQRGNEPRASGSFGRIVNERHASRLGALLDGGGYRRIATGGDVDIEARYLAPTILAGVERDAPVMSEEIFGPILPVVPVRDIDSAIDHVNANDKPLALYAFTRSNKTAERILDRTSSGGACVNDVMTHLLAPQLPFGGVGPSGHGAYHGRWGLEQFSHRKAVLDRPEWFEMPILYPPYGGWKAKIARRLF